MRAELFPIHRSISGQPRKPQTMDRMRVPNELKSALTSQALEIFTVCCNAGQPIQEALLAVYLSGMSAGAGAVTEYAVKDPGGDHG